MNNSPSQSKAIVFDTTMRDGELMPGVKMNALDKIQIAKLLDEMGVDIIEVGYPGNFAKDFDEIVSVSQVVKKATICGLAGSKSDEIVRVAEALRSAKQARIHTYTPVNIKDRSPLGKEKVWGSIQQSISLAREYCDDVEWTPFDAPRSEPDFLCKSIEMAIATGATTINIPDTIGMESPESFSRLLEMIFNRIPNIDRTIISVHCHDDLGMAVDNSIAALGCGARQIECSINGLGARKGNADLAKVVSAIRNLPQYQVAIDTDAIEEVSELVATITGIAAVDNKT
jgi:2-isopropylmalate synthase